MGHRYCSKECQVEHWDAHQGACMRAMESQQQQQAMRQYVALSLMTPLH